VFRAAVLSIVLATSGAPTAALLCRTWCDPIAAAVSGCHHERLANFTIVAGEDGCRNTVLGSASPAQENVRRNVSPGWQYTLALPRYQLTSPSAETRRHLRADRDRSLDNQPLSTALRI
jgi:hypothetical protein